MPRSLILPANARLPRFRGGNISKVAPLAKALSIVRSPAMTDGG